MITIPIWIFVGLVFLAAWALALTFGSLEFKMSALAVVAAFFLTIKRAIERAAAEREFSRIFGRAPMKKKRRPSRKPKGHPRGKRRRRK